MGAVEAKSNQNLLSSYKFLHKKLSPSFGELTIMQDIKTNQLVALREQVFQSLKDYEQETDKQNKQTNFQHPNLVQLHQVHSFCEKQFCSSVYKIVQGIEYLPNDLLSDLAQRKVPYTEHDLMALLRDITSAMGFLQSKGLSYGELRPSTIFVHSNSNRNIYKIAEPSALRVMPGYLSVLTGHDTKGLYFSPKLLEALRQKSWNPKHNVSKSDVFSFGCILLECALRQSSNDFFDYQESRINKQILETRKSMIKDSFSEDFQCILFKMLSYEESKRPDFLELASIIEPNEIVYSNVLKPSNRQTITQENQSENFTEKPKNDSFRSSESIQDKENLIKPVLPSKTKFLKPLITVIEDPELLQREKNPVEDFNEPMRPDDQSTQPIIELLPKSQNQLEWVENRPENTPTTPFQLISINCSPITARQTDIAVQEGVFSKINHEIKEIKDSTPLNSNVSDSLFTVFQYESGFSFIRPEIQAILNEFKKEKATTPNSALINLEAISNQENHVPIIKKEVPEYKETIKETTENIKEISEVQIYKETLEVLKSNQKSNENIKETSKTPKSVQKSNETTIFQKSSQKYEEISETSIKEASESVKIQETLHQNRILVYETYEDGSVYHGEKLNDMRDGRGKFYYSDGGMYDGDWKIGHIDGSGVLFYPNGSVAYEGQWRMDKFHGKGVVFNEVPSENEGFDCRNFEELGEGWVKYEGEFVEDNKEGKGTLTLVNGEVFIGIFYNDFVQGWGKFYGVEGSCIEGEWINNVLREANCEDFEEKV